jgi:hypothetical protein
MVAVFIVAGRNWTDIVQSIDCAHGDIADHVARRLQSESGLMVVVEPTSEFRAFQTSENVL